MHATLDANLLHQLGEAERDVRDAGETVGGAVAEQDRVRHGAERHRVVVPVHGLGVAAAAAVRVRGAGGPGVDPRPRRRQVVRRERAVGTAHGEVAVAAERRVAAGRSGDAVERIGRAVCGQHEPDVLQARAGGREGDVGTAVAGIGRDVTLVVGKVAAEDEGDVLGLELTGQQVVEVERQVGGAQVHATGRRVDGAGLALCEVRPGGPGRRSDEQSGSADGSRSSRELHSGGGLHGLPL